MNIVKSFCFFLLFIFVTQSVQAATPFFADKDDVLYKNHFWADVTFKGESTGVTDFRVIYQAPIDIVFSQLIDTNNLYLHHSSYADSRCLTEANYKKVIETKPATIDSLISLINNSRMATLENRRVGQVWTDYWLMRFAVPWPLNDKWVVQKATVDESKTGMYHVDFAMQAGNVKDLQGWWELVPVPGHPEWTEFRGESESNPGVPVPQFLAKSIFKSSLRHEFEENQTLFQKLLGVKK